jgi:hypothetical protein
VSCNLSKSNRTTPDPLTDLLASTVAVQEDGSLHATTPEARKLMDLLGLNRLRLCEFRALWLRIVRLAAHFDPPLLRQLLGYPADLSDLSALHPPASNRRAVGVAPSYGAQRARGELPDTY